MRTYGLVSHFFMESFKDVLLGDHFKPVPVYFISQLSIFTFLQFDQGRRLSLKTLIWQMGQLLSKVDQKLFDFSLHKVSAKKWVKRTTIIQWIIEQQGDRGLLNK